MLTKCVLVRRTAWECAGKANGAVASRLKLKWTTATSKNLPQRRPRRALPLQCRPVKWTRFARVTFHRIQRKPHPGQCTHLSSGEISGTRKAARNALQICWRSPLQIALIAGCRASWWKLDARMESCTHPVAFQTYWLVFIATAKNATVTARIHGSKLTGALEVTCSELVEWVSEPM